MTPTFKWLQNDAFYRIYRLLDLLILVYIIIHAFYRIYRLLVLLILELIIINCVNIAPEDELDPWDCYFAQQRQVESFYLKLFPFLTLASSHSVTMYNNV